jgi:monoamine oxidase
MPPIRHSRRQFLSLLAHGATTAAFAWPFASRAERPPHVLVLGAGLAGLRSALLLEAQGCGVTILEGRTRLGGRLHTRTDLPGLPEQGGSTLGSTYARMLAMAGQYGIGVGPPPFGHGPKTGACSDCHAQGKVPDRRGGPGTLFCWRGRQVLQGDWIDALPELSERERRVTPDRLLASYVMPGNPLPDTEAWTRPEFAEYDALSVADYLRRLGATPTALQLMDVAPNCPGIDRASALWALRDAQRRAAAGGGAPQRFILGASDYVGKLAGALRSRPLTGREVKAMASTDDKAVVTCRGGERFEADYVVSTLPLPCLARVAFDPLPPAPQQVAFREIAHTPITRVYFRVKKPFWDEDGLPNSMWTDTPLERIFAVRDEGSGQVVALSSHADGPGALELDAMDEDKRLRFATDLFVTLRPAAAGAIEAVASTSWARDPLAGGAYPFYAPGQVGRFRAETARPLGRIHFAGEHTAVTSPGMEGACESADRVVAEVLGRATAGRDA